MLGGPPTDISLIHPDLYTRTPSKYKNMCTQDGFLFIRRESQILGFTSKARRMAQDLWKHNIILLLMFIFLRFFQRSDLDSFVSGRSIQSWYRRLNGIQDEDSSLHAYQGYQWWCYRRSTSELQIFNIFLHTTYQVAYNISYYFCYVNIFATIK